MYLLSYIFAQPHSVLLFLYAYFARNFMRNTLWLWFPHDTKIVLI